MATDGPGRQTQAAPAPAPTLLPAPPAALAASPPTPPPPPLDPGPGLDKACPASAPPADNASKRQLFRLAASAPLFPLMPGDTLTLELSPQGAPKPGAPLTAVRATLSVNGQLLRRVSLPTSALGAAKLYPFLTLPPGAAVSIHAAHTPAPFFAWTSPTLATAETQLCDLDTCVRFSLPMASPPSEQEQGPPQPLPVLEFLGNAPLSGPGTCRWTLQLANSLGDSAAHVFVGVSAPQACDPLRADGPALTAAFAREAADAPSGWRGASGKPPPPPTRRASGDAASSPALLPPVPRHGVWVKLPAPQAPAGAAPARDAPPLPPDPEGSCVQFAAASAPACSITVELDRDTETARFFRNGRSMGAPIKHLSGPLVPALAFQRTGAAQKVYAALVTVAPIAAVDASWDVASKAGDVVVEGPGVCKVADEIGYSGVRLSQGFAHGQHMWLVKVVRRGRGAARTVQAAAPACSIGAKHAAGGRSRCMLAARPTVKSACHSQRAAPVRCRWPSTTASSSASRGVMQTWRQTRRWGRK